MNILQTIRIFWIRTFVFDNNDQSLFLSVIASQLRGGRNLVTIFRDLQIDDNKHIRKLSRKALDPENPYFATRMPEYLGRHRANLLVMAQKFNALEAFITHVLDYKKPYSLLNSIFFRYIMEWFMLAIIASLACAMYLYADLLQLAFGDFTDSLLYDTGAILVEFQFLFYGVFASLTLTYLYFADRPLPLRNQLKKLGLYQFRDADYLIELMTTFHLLTKSATAAGVAVNTPELVRQLAGIYGGGPPTDASYLPVPRRKIRDDQFHNIQQSLARGQSLRDALAMSRMLPSLEMSLYRGLTPKNTIEEHSRAAEMVADQITTKTKIKMRRFSQSIGFILYCALGLGMVLLLDIFSGGATNIMDMMDGATGPR